MIFILPTIIQNLPYIHVSRKFKSWGPKKLSPFGLGLNMTNPALPTWPHDQATIVATVGSMDTVEHERLTDKSAAKTSEEIQLSGQVKSQLDDNAGYLEMIANQVAKAAGDVKAGIQLVQSVGYALVETKEKTKRGFEEISNGPGFSVVRTKRVGKRAGYVFQSGVTTARNIPPATVQPNMYTLTVAIQINGIETGKIYGVRFGVVVPATHNVKVTKKSKATKAATKTAASNSKIPIFNYGEDAIAWSAWIYIVGQ
jgi:hypothetical protein